MANRFPLIVNPDTKEIQEISQNDNLDLTGNGVYAGGSLGQNGQVLTTNGTSVEWRTVTGGGGGSGGIDSDTTYIVEAEDQADGASLNLVAGGSGIGTIRIKFQDSNQLQFDTIDNLTIAPTIKAGSIENSQLLNNKFTFRINGIDTEYSLGSTVIIPQYGDVFATATQAISNKTFTDCTMSLAPSTGNSIVSIPNSALLNKGLNINGTFYELGDSVTIVGGGGADTNTTYTLSTVDWADGQGNNRPEAKAIRLTGSDGATSNSVLVAGDRMTISRDATTGEIRFDATEINTDTDTTYNISTTSLNAGNTVVGAKINLNSSSGSPDTVNFRGYNGLSISSISDSDINFTIAQDISTTSDVTFNNLTINGGLTVNGATTYVDTTNLVVTDKTITIADGVTNSELANNAGLYIGTSNINLAYNHATTAWTSTSDFNLVSTKVYKIGGTDVLTATRVLGKTMPLGDLIGTIDTQTLSNKTLNSPTISEILNTGTLYLPAPPIADTLVGRATSDILTNKQIDGNNNTITNIGNSSLSNSYMVINGTQRSLGDTFTVTATDAYTDEKAQDTVAGMITSATHSGISFAYDDTAGTLAATVDNISSTTGTIEMRGQTSKLRFHYDQLSDLPSASDWHGMFAHVHATGAAYYAHGGSWVELANAGSGGGTPSSITDGTSTLGFNSNNDLELACHIIPDTNAAYDLGSAEYKIRHLFLSDNTIYSDSGTMRIAQQAPGEPAGQPTQLFTVAKIKEVMQASADFAAFKTNIEALLDD